MFCFSLGLKHRQFNIGHPDLLPHAWWFLCPCLCFLPRQFLPLDIFGYHGSCVSNSLCPLKFVTASLFAKLVSLCLPFVSLARPLSPFLSPCSCLQLLLGLVSSSAPPLKALEFYCSEKNAKACGYQRVCQET